MKGNWKESYLLVEISMLILAGYVKSIPKTIESTLNINEEWIDIRNTYKKEVTECSGFARII